MISAAVTTALLFGQASSVKAEEAKQYTQEQIEEIIQKYLISNPKLVVDALNEYQRQEEQRMQEQASKALSENMDFLVNNPNSPFVGKEDAEKVVVEFFDYNCGYCKRALGDIKKVIENHDNVKVIFKEFPILSPDSELAARYALAANEQEKYFEFHTALMESKGRISESRLLDIAEGLSLDIEQLKEDKDSEEITSLINKTREAAQEIGVRGTPAFVVGDELIRGAVGYDVIKEYLEKE